MCFLRCTVKLGEGNADLPLHDLERSPLDDKELLFPRDQKNLATTRAPKQCRTTHPLFEVHSQVGEESARLRLDNRARLHDRTV